ncbi:metal-binding protein [Cyanobacterium sp. Dongsha4]|uniref:metal-binding protein n=1 Tax=Cyanobacterium sp. DS4 TaxID=2878255 RepID=UPI002E80010E|nr:metal-binding protein [Cyanobacterium sp. Dongsha4]WVL00056.1 metal-binding protein [Cyanobacterium sp. Dongsha4]
MPSGKIHDQITWFCLPLVIILFFIVTKSLLLTTLGGFGFVFSGLMFGPDLDIYSIQFQRWRFFRFIWLPYQKTLKHRSIFSHGFLLGTLIRLIYLSLILFILAILGVAIAQLIFGFGWHWQKFIFNSYRVLKNNYWQEVLSLFIGLELGAMSHYLADDIGSKWKSRQRKKSVSRKKSKRVVRKNTRRK